MTDDYGRKWVSKNWSRWKTDAHALGLPEEAWLPGVESDVVASSRAAGELPPIHLPEWSCTTPSVLYLLLWWCTNLREPVQKATSMERLDFYAAKLPAERLWPFKDSGLDAPFSLPPVGSGYCAISVQDRLVDLDLLTQPPAP